MRILVLTGVLLCLGWQLHAQKKFTYILRGDSVKVTNCDSSELIIENHTQAVPGFLFNTGNGRTIFQRGAQPLGNGAFLIGADTIRTAANAWLQGGNSFGATGVLGTLDSNHLDLYTSGAGRARITDTGNFIIGDTVDHGQKLQVNGNSYFNGGQFITGTMNVPNELGFTYFNPIINPFVGDGSYAAGMQIAPTLNASANSQQLIALQVSPNYNLGSYTQQTDGISPAVYVTSNLGGIRIDQNFSYPGITGEPLFIYQGGFSDKSAILCERNGNNTQTPFIWNDDIRPVATQGVIIPIIKNSFSEGIAAGGGVSITMDRYYQMNEATIKMLYEATPDSSTAQNTQTSIALITHDSILGSVTPLYINGANIGMGVNTPTAQLHTTGSVRFAGLTEDDTQNNILVSDASGNLFYRSASSLAATEPVRSSLVINGPIKAKRVIVSPDEWADYVFDSTYNLKPIASLDTYIRKEHHLPGVPSAVQVQKDGLDVGAGQAILLKKIEELTLYSIGQEKQMTDQQKEIDALKKEVEALKNLIKSH